MADIELVIKMPEEDYHRIASGFGQEDDAVLLEKIFKNGTLLDEYLDEIEGVIFKACEHLEDKDGIVKIVLDVLDKYKEGEEG